MRLFVFDLWEFIHSLIPKNRIKAYFCLIDSARLLIDQHRELAAKNHLNMDQSFSQPIILVDFFFFQICKIAYTVILFSVSMYVNQGKCLAL